MVATQTRQRKRSTLTSSVEPGASDRDLPPARRGKATAKQKVSLPGYNVRFSTFIYVICALALAFILFHAWKLLQLKTQVGDWWNVATGQMKPLVNSGKKYDPDSTWRRFTKDEKERLSVEDHIEALANALGMPSKELATAIAEAVRSYLPPASLSSISAAEATASGRPANILLGEEEESQPGTGLKDKLGALSSFDDPISEEQHL